MISTRAFGNVKLFRALTLYSIDDVCSWRTANRDACIVSVDNFASVSSVLVGLIRVSALLSVIYHDPLDAVQ